MEEGTSSIGCAWKERKSLAPKMGIGEPFYQPFPPFGEEEKRTV
jgi:hypothetical protein